MKKDKSSPLNSPRHMLSPEDAALFAAANETPPAPTKRAKAAARAYRARVVHAD